MEEKALRRRQQAEAASLSRMGTAILKGMRLNLKWLLEGNDLGYTNGNEKTVYVAWEHPYFAPPLSAVEKAVFRMGVFAHELLHQVLTNFSYTTYVAKSMSQAEAAIFMRFANTLEDPAIEYFAPQVFGGKLLNALRFNIRHVYRMSSGIEDSPTAFSQLINALIFFGDMGMVKGRFTFPEAYEYFKKVAPKYNEGITCPDSRRRIDIAKECMEMTRPLWEEEVKERERFEEFLKDLMNALERMAGGGEPDEGTEKKLSSSKGSSPIDEMRKELLKKLGEAGDKGEAGGKGEGEEDGESGSGSGSEEAEDGESAGKSDPSAEKALDSGGGDKGECEEHDEAPGADVTKDADEADEIAEDVFDITDDMVKDIEKAIEDEEKALEKKERSEMGDSGDKPLPEYDIESPAFGKVSCLNLRAENGGSLAALYKEECAKHARDIKTLKKALERILEADKEQEARATSGAYNIKRGSIGTTARIFDKRRDPAKLNDLAVMLVVDMSGSMGGTKMAEARKTALIFAEALTQLNIPYYIMGFSADEMGYRVVNFHFVDWGNRKSDRESIMSMSARCNNFDGYSIRYASNILKDKPAGRKLMLVISDGVPLANGYSGREGIADTTNAIKDARKIATTFGIAIGSGCTPETLQKMYGKDFIFCENVSLLSNLLGKKLKKLLKDAA